MDVEAKQNVARARASKARQESLHAGRGKLLAREFNADNTRICAVWLDDIHRRLDSQWLRAQPRLAQRERACT